MPELKILNPKNPSDHRRLLKSGVPPLQFRSIPNFLIESFAYDVFHKSKTYCRKRSLLGETYKWKGNNHELEKNQVSSIFWKPKYTQLENEEPSPPVKGSAIN